MTDLIHRESEGNIKYEVYYDYDEVDRLFTGRSMDFENEEEKDDYLNKFRKGYLSAYGIKKYEKCQCCEGWKCIDSLWGIHAEDYDQALEYYKGDL